MPAKIHASSVMDIKLNGAEGEWTEFSVNKSGRYKLGFSQGQILFLGIAGDSQSSMVAERETSITKDGKAFRMVMLLKLL